MLYRGSHRLGSWISFCWAMEQGSRLFFGIGLCTGLGIAFIGVRFFLQNVRRTGTMILDWTLVVDRRVHDCWGRSRIYLRASVAGDILGDGICAPSQAK